MGRRPAIGDGRTYAEMGRQRFRNGTGSFPPPLREHGQKGRTALAFSAPCNSVSEAYAPIHDPAAAKPT
jgi:hypothetical protein